MLIRRIILPEELECTSIVEIIKQVVLILIRIVLTMRTLLNMIEKG